MTRFLALTAVAAGMVAVVAAQQKPIFRGVGDTVRVFATVTDKDGRLVTNLTRDVFEVRDEGKPQPLTAFDNSPLPIRLIVMLDVSGSMEGNLSLLRAAADQLFARLRPDDVARVGTFGQSITISPEFTRDRAELRSALPEFIDPHAPTPLWRALDKGLDVFGEQAEGRRDVILVLSDGQDSGPTGFAQPISSQAQVIDHARDREVMIYAVGMRSRSSRSTGPAIGAAGLEAAILADLPDPGLARVAEETGGGYLEIRQGQDLGAAFVGVAEELHSQYLLGFSPPKRDGKVHSLEVKVSQKGLKPRARRNYVAPK